MRDLVKKNSFIRGVVITTLISFFSFSIIPSQALAQGVLLGLPQPGVMVSFSPSFTPALLRGVEVHPDDPLRFDFIIDSGDSGLEGQALEQEARKLITHFLASLTIPEDDFWVNLSPYEQDRIIADALSQTEMGRDLLAQDYILKQMTSSLMHPDHELGKVFWDRVYEKAYQQYGTTQIPVDTFNKVWIVPSQAVVYEHGHYAFVGERHLSVMLEEDYIALEHNQDRRDLGPTHFESQKTREVATLSSGVVRDVLLPEIEKEVNQGELFAPLRQIFDAAILAAWYKTALRESILNQVYSDQNKVLGIDMEDKTVKERIYNQYLEAFEKGVCDLIRVEKDIATDQYIPRKYFTGGIGKFTALATNKILSRKPLTSENAGAIKPIGGQKKVSVGLDPAKQRVGTEASATISIPESMGDISEVSAASDYAINRQGSISPARVNAFIATIVNAVEEYKDEVDAVTYEKIQDEIEKVVGRGIFGEEYRQIVREFIRREDAVNDLGILRDKVVELVETYRIEAGKGNFSFMVGEIDNLSSNFGSDQAMRVTLSEVTELAGRISGQEFKQRTRIFHAKGKRIDAEDVPRLISGSISWIDADQAEMLEDGHEEWLSLDQAREYAESEARNYLENQIRERYPNLSDQERSDIAERININLNYEKNEEDEGRDIYAIFRANFTASDHVMETDATDPSALGGIDLGTAVSALEIRRDAGGMPLPLSQQPLELQNIEGFVPLIINIMPFNPQLILGEIEAQDAQDFVQVSMAK